MLQHRLVTASLGRARTRGRSPGAGVDRRRAGRSRPRRRGRGRRGDHERSADLRGYTESVNRGVTIAALSACGAAGAIMRDCCSRWHRERAPTTGTTTTVTTTAPTTTRRDHRHVPTVAHDDDACARTQPKLIAAGVTVGGTLVGGLTVGEAKDARQAAVRAAARARRRAGTADRRDPEGARRDAAYRRGRERRRHACDGPGSSSRSRSTCHGRRSSASSPRSPSAFTAIPSMRPSSSGT